MSKQKEQRGCGGYAWWVAETCDPRHVYIYGMNMPSENTCYYVYSPPTNTHYSHNAYAKDLFDTEEEAYAELTKRLDALHREFQERTNEIKQRLTIIAEHMEALAHNKANTVKSWTSVTTPDVVLSGSSESRTDITVQGNGILTIEAGATVARLSVKEGGKCIVNNGHVQNVDVYDSARLSMSGGTLSHCTIREHSEIFLTGASGGDLRVSSDASVFVNSNAYVSCTIIYDGGRMSVRGMHTCAESVVVSSGGRLFVSSGGILKACVVASGGTLSKESPYRVVNLTVDKGGEDHEI